MGQAILCPHCRCAALSLALERREVPLVGKAPRMIYRPGDEYATCANGHIWRVHGHYV